jgi:hypothetical protein
MANPEFFELFRVKFPVTLLFRCLCYADSFINQEEMIGRGISDLVPPGLNQYMEYTLHRQMLASVNSCVTFGVIMTRMDGTMFKCITNWIMLMDENMNKQDTISIHLDSVEDLTMVSPMDTPLPRKKPKISLELDYPESPKPCHMRENQEEI